MYSYLVGSFFPSSRMEEGNKGQGNELLNAFQHYMYSENSMCFK